MALAAATSRGSVPSRRRIIGRLLVLLIAVWLLGFLRAPGAAQDALVRTEAGVTVGNIATTTLPAIPPFWIVSIQATITETTGTHYTAATIYLIEPWTGWTLTLGAG
jgi:hypothetical protein